MRHPPDAPARAIARAPFALLLAATALLTACGAARPRRPAALPPARTQATATLVHDEGMFYAAGGLRLYEQSWRPNAPGVAHRGAVVLVHGLKDHSARYAVLAATLVAHGYAVYAFDLRGHGRSDGERVWVDAFDQYVGDLAQFVARVRAREPAGTPLYLFGHSMGGAIATLYTLLRRPPLAGLILSAPALRSDVSGFTAGVTAFVAALIPHAAVFDLPDRDFSRDPAAVRALAHDPLVTHGAGPARTAAELLSAMDRIGARMEQLTVPVLLLHGTADRLTSPRGSRELYRRARGADRTITLYGGLYHDLWHEPEAPRVTADLLRWLDQRTRRVGETSPPAYPATTGRPSP